LAATGAFPVEALTGAAFAAFVAGFLVLAAAALAACPVPAFAGLPDLAALFLGADFPFAAFAAIVLLIVCLS
jgi:hypothetical protein